MQGAAKLLELHPGDDVADRLGAHPGPEDPAAARPGARPVPLVEIAEVGLGQGDERLEALDLVTLAPDLVLATLGGVLALLAARVDGGPHLDLEVGDLLLGRPLLALFPEAELLGHALGLGRRDLAEACDGLLRPLLAGREDNLAGGNERDGLLGDPGLQLGEPPLDLLGCAADLVGAARSLGLEVREQGSLGRHELVLLAREDGALLVVEVVAALAGPATPRGLLVESHEGAPARVLVDVGDDIQREVEDPLEVARADVQQDAQARRRSLEVPDVADGAGELDVAHPLAPDLGPGDLDAALVADDALVADPLVLAAVALPVLRGTEDALVEEAILLGLEGPVVDRLGLRDLARGPVADLLRRRQRDTDGVEVVDLEHGSPPRRRGSSAARYGPGASGAGPAERRPRDVKAGASPRTRRG